MTLERPAYDYAAGPCFPPRPSDFKQATRKRSANRSRWALATGGLLLAAGVLTVPAKDFLFGPTQPGTARAPVPSLAIADAANRVASKASVPSQAPVQKVASNASANHVAVKASAPSQAPAQIFATTPAADLGGSKASAASQAPAANSAAVNASTDANRLPDVTLGPVDPPLLLTSADVHSPAPGPQPPKVAATPSVPTELQSGAFSAASLGHGTLAAAAPLDTGSIKPPVEPSEPPGPVPSPSDVTVKFAALRTQAETTSQTSRVAALGNVVVVQGSNGPAPRVDSERLLARAQKLIAEGDISGARLMLERAFAEGSDRAAFQLAETYDPRMLLEWRVVGLSANAARARELYGIAADRGVTAAKERLVGLD
jgi:hypothetical protein